MAMASGAGPMSLGTLETQGPGPFAMARFGLAMARSWSCAMKHEAGPTNHEPSIIDESIQELINSSINRLIHVSDIHQSLI